MKEYKITTVPYHVKSGGVVKLINTNNQDIVLDRDDVFLACRYKAHDKEGILIFNQSHIFLFGRAPSYHFDIIGKCSYERYKVTIDKYNSGTSSNDTLTF